MKNKNKLFKFIFASPVVIYSLLLIFLPLIYIFIISFFKSDGYGGMIKTISLHNYIQLFDVVYIKIFLQSILIALVVTFICILITYPFVIAISHKSKIIQKVLMTLVMVPFLTNSLVRMYGWIVLLRKYGVVNKLLLDLKLIDNPLQFMYNNFGIIIGMVYTLLPFMILPLYNAVSSIDKSLIEASNDLGASKKMIFSKIILPMTKSALFNGSLMVFTPALGYFFIVDVAGGGKIMILGNLIKNQFLTARNWPFGASVSVFLLIITGILVGIYRKTGGKMEDLG